jgi:hypothetical protein
LKKNQIALACALMAACLSANAQTVFNANQYGIPGQVVGDAHNTMPMVTPMMVTGLGNWVGSQIQQAAQTLNAAQVKQSQIQTKLTDASNNARAQTAMQIADGQVQAQLALAQPTDSNGQNIRLSNNCGMGGGASGGAVGLATGAATGITTAAAVSGVLRNYNANTANLNNSQYVNALAATKPQDLVSNSIIGDPSGAGIAASSYSPESTKRYIQITTNPTPLPNLPPKADSTPAGKRYQALQNLQKAVLDIPQETLNGVSQMNAPTLPMKTWIQGELTRMNAPASLVSAFNSAAQAQLPPASPAASATQTVATGVVCGLGAAFGPAGMAGCLALQSGAVDGNNNVSPQNFLYTMVQARVANPNWWSSLTKMNSAPPLLQEIAEIDALRAQMEYTNMVNISRIASMQAQQMAEQENSKIIPQASQLRDTAIAQSAQK